MVHTYYLIIDRPTWDKMDFDTRRDFLDNFWHKYIPYVTNVSVDDKFEVFMMQAKEESSDLNYEN